MLRADRCSEGRVWLLTSGLRLGSSHFLGGSNRGSGLMRVVSPANLGRAQSGGRVPVCVHKNVQMPSQGVSGLVLKETHSAQMIPHMRQSQFPRLFTRVGIEQCLGLANPLALLVPSLPTR